jgi:hypothetical protein
MTAGELAEKLSKVEPSTLVILQRDAEGNGYSPLAGADSAFYQATSAWAGEVYETDEPDGDTPCVVLYPVN